MAERFGRNQGIALATTREEKPFVRYVNAYYEDGTFYVITYALSRKMEQLAQNSQVAIAEERFTANGTGRSLGYFGKPENTVLAAKLRRVFAARIDNGHNNFADENTIILALDLTDGVLFSHGTRYDLDFTEALA